MAEKIKAPLQFQLIGYAGNGIPPVANSLFSQTGHYSDVELAARINSFDPHVILFPSICPETYSYTLSSAITSGRPIMATNLGAFPERLVGYPWVWLIDWNISSVQLVDKLCEIRTNNFFSRKEPISQLGIEIDKSDIVEDISFYENGYLLTGGHSSLK